jgi:hypothetical protein
MKAKQQKFDAVLGKLIKAKPVPRTSIEPRCSYPFDFGSVFIAATYRMPASLINSRKWRPFRMAFRTSATSLSGTYIENRRVPRRPYSA